MDINRSDRTEAHLELGRHIDLIQIMLEQTLLADSTVYGFTNRAAVAFAKASDEMLLDAIIKKAKEAGITDLYVLNEDFILAAIREKMERGPAAHVEDGHCSNCGRPVATDCWGGGMEANNYCYYCGAKLTEEE